MQEPGFEFGQKRIAFVIGIEHYKNYNRLEYSPQSAEDVYELLVSPVFGNCDPKLSVKEIITPDRSLTSSDFDGMVREAVKRLGQGDQFVFYFCGHGKLHGNDLHFIMPESQKDVPLDNYNFRTMIGHLKDSRVNKAVLIADTCHSAAMLSSAGELMDDWKPGLPKGFGFMAASGKFQYARQTSALKRTIFSHYLCEGIKNWTKPGAPYISLSELKEYINEQKEKKHPEADQTVHTLIQEGDGKIWLSLNPSYIPEENRSSQLEDFSVSADEQESVMNENFHLKKMQTSSEPSETQESQFEKLLSWLNKLLDAEFRNMIYSLLNVEQQNSLPFPVTQITRGDFLGAMKVYGLDKAEKYLLKKYPDRFTPGNLQRQVGTDKKEGHIGFCQPGWTAHNVYQAHGDVIVVKNDNKGTDEQDT